jgi:hypothetical protein
VFWVQTLPVNVSVDQSAFSVCAFSLCLLLCPSVWSWYPDFLSGLIIRPFLSELCCEASHLIFALIVLFVSVSGRAGIPVSARTFSVFSLSIHLSIFPVALFSPLSPLSASSFSSPCRQVRRQPVFSGGLLPLDGRYEVPPMGPLSASADECRLNAGLTHS